ncbi:hypothetical protein ACFE04_017224 [Oxalis oulophora]
MNTNTRNLQANEPPTQNDSTMHGPLIVAMDEEISRAHFFLRQRDEMIEDMTKQIRQITEENYAMVHRLRNITMHNEKLAGKNEELKINITRLRDTIGPATLFTLLCQLTRHRPTSIVPSLSPPPTPSIHHQTQTLATTRSDSYDPTTVIINA